MTILNRAPFRTAALLLVILVPWSASPVVGGDADVLRDWSLQIGEIDRLLLDSRWKKALRSSEGLTGEMVNRIVRGSAAREYLGNVVMRQAIAYSGIGEVDNATWTTQVALQILPSLVDFPLERYGQVGMRLHSVEVRKLGDSLQPQDVTADSKPSADAKITPPRRITGRKPDYPWAKRTSIGFDVVVEVILGVDGVPRHPVIKKSDGEFTAVYAVLNEMREWRFRPGKLNDEIVEVLYTLKAKFRP